MKLCRLQAEGLGRADADGLVHVDGHHLVADLLELGHLGRAIAAGGVARRGHGRGGGRGGGGDLGGALEGHGCDVVVVVVVVGSVGVCLVWVGCSCFGGSSCFGVLDCTKEERKKKRKAVVFILFDSIPDSPLSWFFRLPTGPQR